MFGLSLTMFVVTVLIVLASGAATMLLLPRFSHDKRITMLEFGIVSLVLIVILVPSVGLAGGAIARANAVDGYWEYWNGNIIAAESQEYTCERDGICVHTYDCDPYQVREIVRYDITYYTDIQGKQQERRVPVREWVTHYHQCPSATHEYSYTLESSLGNTYTIASHIFASDAKPWRNDRNLPDVKRGAPQRWLDVQIRIKNGDLPWDTKRVRYRNYLLAAQDSILSAYSGSVEKYREAGLLPFHTAGLDSNPMKNGYEADKVVFAGVKTSEVDNYRNWQEALGRLNSYLGETREGDLHVAVVPADRIDNPDDYASALLAYLQSREMGKEGLAKNTILLIIGVSADGQTVEWSRAKTGIPEGNGGMLDALATDLQDRPMVPETLLGWPKAHLSNGKRVFTPSDGAVEQIILRDHPFARACMEKCDDPGDNGSGYVYLKASAYISTSAQIGIGVALFILGLACFATVAWFDLNPARLLHALRRRQQF